jgi:hypothetical protein
LNTEIDLNLPFVLISDLNLKIFELNLLVVPDPSDFIQVLKQVVLAAKESLLVLEISWLSFARGTFKQHLVSLEHVASDCYCLLWRGLFD